MYLRQILDKFAKWSSALTRDKKGNVLDSDCTLIYQPSLATNPKLL